MKTNNCTKYNQQHEIKYFHKEVKEREISFITILQLLSITVNMFIQKKVYFILNHKYKTASNLVKTSMPLMNEWIAGEGTVSVIIVRNSVPYVYVPWRWWQQAPLKCWRIYRTAHCHVPEGICCHENLRSDRHSRNKLCYEIKVKLQLCSMNPRSSKACWCLWGYLKK